MDEILEAVTMKTRVEDVCDNVFFMIIYSDRVGSDDGRVE
jgi:hypothetical protein